jgi:hypothetical protein
MTSGPHIGWLAGGSVLTVAAIAWGAFNVVDVIAHEVTTVTETLDATGLSMVDIDTDDGRVIVTGTDSDEITIVARVSDGLGDTGNSYRVVDDRLEIRGTCPVFGSMWCSVDYQIEVPADMALDIDTDDDRVEVVDVLGALTLHSDNGRIEIRGAEGPITASTDNGQIEATGIRSASVVADTDNGRIEIVMATPPESIEASTDNGRVEVVVPDTAGAYAVTTSTDNGNIRTEVRVDPTSSRTIDVRTDNGSIIIRYPD